MDPDIEEHYNKLMKQWRKDDDGIKEFEEIDGYMDEYKKLEKWHSFFLVMIVKLTWKQLLSFYGN